jgi:YidC/Oxa1 family membrane protein insertase
MLIVMIPLMIAAGIFTHITARHSVARQTAAQGENPQTAIMNKLMLYVFPIGVVVGAPFLPLAVLLYWVSNNLWTLGQQYVVYRRIAVEESTKHEQVAASRQALAPRPGQKPVRPEPSAEEPNPKTPGAKPVTRKSTGPATNGASNGSAQAAANGDGSSPNGAAKSANGTAGESARGARSSGPSRPPARRTRKRR